MAPIVSEPAFTICNDLSRKVEIEEVNGQQKAIIRLNVDGFRPENIVVTSVDNKLVLFSWSEGEKEQNELSHIYHMPKNADLLDAEATLLNNGDLTISVPISDGKMIELYIREKFQVVLTRLLLNKPRNTKTLHAGGKKHTILNTIRTFSNLRDAHTHSQQATATMLR